MKVSVTDFSAPIGASVFKFCVHLKVGKVYCVNENKGAKAHFAFFFNFSFCHSLNEQNIYAICKIMLFSKHIDVFKSCLGPL